MKPLYARSLTDEERAILRQSVKSNDGFRVRRAQMLLLSADEQLKVDEIGQRVGCHGQAVRKAIHGFHEKGLACLEGGSHARHDDQRAYNDQAGEQLRELIQHSPRDFDYDTSLWTLDLLAQASFEQGLTETQVSGETVRATLAAMDIVWRRAKHWITSPDPNYDTKKSDGTG
jgi:transposase